MCIRDRPLDECFDRLDEHRDADEFVYECRREKDGGFLLHLTLHLSLIHVSVDLRAEIIHHLFFPACGQPRGHDVLKGKAGAAALQRVAIADVYKRQQRELDSAKQKAGYHYHSDTLPLLVYRSESVSYTHLDVYKRQCRNS